MDDSRPLLTIFGCGYVGSALARAALARGWEVRALTRNVDKAAQLKELGVAVQVTDLADRDWHRRWPRRGDYLVDCVSAADRSIEGYHHSYVEGLKSIVAWTAAGDATPQVIYTGSSSVYPQTDGSAVTEADTGFDWPGLRPTAEVLLEAEDCLREPLPGIRRAIVLRLAGLYGPDRHYLLNQLQSGTTTFPGSGDYLINLIHRDDAVAAIFAALEAPADLPDRTFNISDGQPVIKRELVEWLAARLQLPQPTFDPSAPTPRQRQRANASGALPNRHILNNRARKQLNWQPQFPDFQAGYEALIGMADG